MDEPEDLDLTAADYVIGTLDADERRAFLRRLARDPAAADAVRTWQERLAPMALALPPMVPTADLFPAIAARIDDTALPTPANDRGSTWRWATLAASLVAVVATGVALRQPIVPPPVAPMTPRAPVQAVAFQPTQIAALSANGQTPGLFVTFDKASGKVRVIPVGLTPDKVHDFELWLIQGKAPPQPMGVIDVRHSGLHRSPSPVNPDATFAVSVEPLGGSPTGIPTGKVVYSGTLVPVPTA